MANYYENIENKSKLTYVTKREVFKRQPKGARLLSDFFPDSVERKIICQNFTLRGSYFGFLARTKVNCERYEGKRYVLRSVKVFFTKETLDRDIEFLENYPNAKNGYLKAKKQMAVDRLKELREKAFGDLERQKKDEENENKV